jgi:hypothetical protein
VAGELEEVVEASLVRRLGDGSRYELLELVRWFAADKLHSTGDEAELRARHRRYYAEQITPIGAAFEAGGAAGELAEPIWRDHANVRAALAAAIDGGDDDTAIALAVGMQPLWLAGNLDHESGELVDRLLSRVNVPPDRELALLRFLAGTEEQGDRWQRRFADRAAELGDAEALGIATTQLFAMAINARERDEMARLRPVLIELLEAGTSPRALGWVHYSLSAGAYVEGHYEIAYEHAARCLERAEELEFEFMIACATDARLLARSAVEGKIQQADLAGLLDVARRHGIHSIAVGALWFAARYAASADAALATRWIALAERILIELDQSLWPEDVLRDETVALLGLTDLRALADGVPPLDAGAALDEASAWVATRDPDETSPRELFPAGAITP